MTGLVVSPKLTTEETVRVVTVRHDLDICSVAASHDEVTGHTRPCDRCAFKPRGLQAPNSSLSFEPTHGIGVTQDGQNPYWAGYSIRSTSSMSIITGIDKSGRATPQSGICVVPVLPRRRSDAGGGGGGGGVVATKVRPDDGTFAARGDYRRPPTPLPGVDGAGTPLNTAFPDRMSTTDSSVSAFALTPPDTPRP